VRIAFVISEHAGGLLPERMDHYRRAERRLSQLARADVTPAHYSELDAVDADATVLSGSFDPWSAHDASALDRLSEALRAHDGPVLGICAGMQLLVRAAGGTVATAEEPTGAGFAAVDVLDESDLLIGLEPRIEVYEHHTDEVTSLPAGFRVLASSEACRVEAVAAGDRPWWGTQFHPEEWSAEHPAGRTVVENFLRLAAIPLR
jgi:GMP synthase (glutamine-hydrolysing)